YGLGNVFFGHHRIVWTCYSNTEQCNARNGPLSVYAAFFHCRVKEPPRPPFLLWQVFFLAPFEVCVESVLTENPVVLVARNDDTGIEPAKRVGGFLVFPRSVADHIRVL